MPESALCEALNDHNSDHFAAGEGSSAGACFRDFGSGDLVCAWNVEASFEAFEPGTIVVSPSVDNILRPEVVASMIGRLRRPME